MDETQIDVTVPPSGTGCAECEVSGSWWVHLRRCAKCGHIGCCDDSLGQHATAHAATSGHSVITSFEPGESWFYSYESLDFVNGPALATPTSHPLEQSAPGPAERLPRGWQEELQQRG